MKSLSRFPRKIFSRSVGVRLAAISTAIMALSPAWLLCQVSGKPLKMGLNSTPFTNTRVNIGQNADATFYNGDSSTGANYIMATRVWVYPERTFEMLGAVRWVASWEEVRPSAVGQEEIDPDSDIIYHHVGYLTKEMAMEDARKLIRDCKTAFGQVTVTRQVVDWFVEEDRVAEWRDTGDVEYVDNSDV